MTTPSADLFRVRPLGRTGLTVPGIGIGGSPLGGAAGLYGHDTGHDDAVATITRVLDGPFTFLDTSNGYSGGDSERRIGTALAARGGIPDGFLLATKVDADPQTGRFDGARVRRSFDESLHRLGVDRVPLLHLHDPELHVTVEEATSRTGAVPALLALKEEGLVDAVGIAGGRVSEMTRYVHTGVFDVLLTHNRFTLVDRSAQTLIEDAAQAGLGVINAAPFGGGILARGPRPADTYAYGMGTPEQVRAAAVMARVCAEVGIPLAAAALRFAVSIPQVSTVLVGASHPARIDALTQLATIDVPNTLMAELDRLAPSSESWIPAEF